MSEAENAIVVTNLHKSFRLPHENHSGVKQLLINLTSKKKSGYEIQEVIKDVSFQIKKGEFFGIVGRNGSGKSTLLKLLSGIYTPDKGHIQVNGSLTPFIELGVGFNPELTGRENVFLNGALLGFSHSQMEAMYEEIVAFAELERFMDQKLKNYSSGMQVRLAFSIAIQAETDILVLDEVLAVGDEAFQRKCIEYFYELKKRNKTVILVTHSMESVRRFCDRAILLDGGEVVVDEKNVDHVADEYSKLFLPDQNDKNNEHPDQERFGTGEVVFANIEHKYDKQKLTIEFDVINTTHETVEGIWLGVDFFTNGELVTGNGSKYTDGFKKGFTMRSKEEKRMAVAFPNYFGNFKFDVNLSLRNEAGTNICDEIKPAIRFQSNNTHLAQYFRLTIPIEIKDI